VNLVLGYRYRLPRHLSYTNSSQPRTTRFTGRSSRVSSIALPSRGAPSKRDRGFIRFKRPHQASSLLAVRNATIVGNSAQWRRCKRKATASPLAVFFWKEITTTKPLILFIFGKEFRGTRSRPESDRVGKHSER